MLFLRKELVKTCKSPQVLRSIPVTDVSLLAYWTLPLVGTTSKYAY